MWRSRQSVLDPATARRRMVEDQLVGRGIRHGGVLEVMGRLPRELFLAPEDRDLAYDDGPQTIGHGATISQPYIVALMTEVLEPHPGDRILEVGTGSGYQTAILAELAADVFSIEIEEPLSEHARALLGELGYANVSFRCGDGRSGWPEAAPFDAILLTAAPASEPRELFEQLAVGGRLVAPVGIREQELILWRRNVSGLTRRTVTWVRFLPLRAAEEPLR